MPIAAAFAVLFGLGTAAALLASGSRVRRASTVVLGVTAVLLPFVTETSQPLLLFTLALAGWLVMIRTFDLAPMEPPLPVRRRLWHVFAIFDTRRAEPMAPAFDSRLLRRAGAWSLIAAAAFVVGVFVANTQEGALHYALRWGGSAVFSLSAFEIAGPLLTLAYGLKGIRIPMLHDAPYLSTSVREFWGARWNRVVGTWLRENCHEPLARRGHPGLGVAAAFVVSAVAHSYLIVAALGWSWALPMGVFFAAQLLLLAAERALRVSRWPRPAAHAWTVGALLLVVPLFLEPMMQMMDVLVGHAV